MSSSTKQSENLSAHYQSTKEELQVLDKAFDVVCSFMGTLEEDRGYLISSQQRDLRETGIYEAHLHGVRDEEIAHYGDYRVEYVTDVINWKSLEAYSRRTGNAICGKLPVWDA